MTQHDVHVVLPEAALPVQDLLVVVSQLARVVLAGNTIGRSILPVIRIGVQIGTHFVDGHVAGPRELEVLQEANLREAGRRHGVAFVVVCIQQVGGIRIGTTQQGA